MRRSPQFQKDGSKVMHSKVAGSVLTLTASEGAKSYNVAGSALDWDL